MTDGRKIQEWTVIQVYRPLIVLCLAVSLAGVMNAAATEDKNTALLTAAKKGQIEEVKRLLAEGADVNVIDERGLTPLMEASYMGHVQVVTLLLHEGADTKIKDNSGWNALMIAWVKGHTEIAGLLQTHGAYAVSPQDKNAFLIKAVEQGWINTVKRLLAQGVDVNTKDDDGYTPLLAAVYHCQRDVAKMLKAKGAVDTLATAAGRGDVAELNRLLSKEIDVNATYTNGWTALMTASTNGQMETVKLLVAKGADVNAKDKNGLTPLMYASGQGHAEVAKLLLNRGSNVNAKTRYGGTALYYACLSKHAEIVKLLRAYGAKE